MSAFISSCLFDLLKASWQGGVLILLVLAAQWVFGRRLNPRWRYGLWLLVVIRLALPWTIPSPVSLFNVLNASAESPLSAVAKPMPGNDTSPRPQSTAEAPAKQPAAASTVQSPASPRLNWKLAWLLGVWFAGASALVIYLLVTQRRISRWVAGRRPLIDEAVLNLLEDCKQQTGVRVPIALVETGQVGSPALFGFVRPRLLLPAGLTRSFSKEELRHVFLHELGHLKRHDILAGWLMTGLQILHWFNPLVWLASYRMRVDRELACDALALSYVREDEEQSYGDTIIKLLESFGRSRWTPNLAGAVENKNQLQERIAMIAAYKKTNRGLVLALALFAGLGLVTLTDAEPGTPLLASNLVGTWVRVGSPGEAGEAPAIGGVFKTLTATHWSLSQTDSVSGAVILHDGGTWTLNGDEYSEKVEFANKNTRFLVHHTFHFHIKLDGDKLTLIGIGNPWKEVWKRANSETPQRLPSDAIPQGTWHGTEAGMANGGQATLTLKGSSLEFHGASTNEWYKGTFTLYHTTPRQIVVRIEDCAMPQFKGATSYAIYKLQAGTLTLTGNPPGDPMVPARFDDPASRKFVFKRE